MLFDPEDGKTDDEIIEIALRRMKPETRAHLEHISQVSGRSIRELVDASLTYMEEHIKDPVQRAAWLAINGSNLTVIQSMLNHKSLSSTQVYARLSVEPVRLALDDQAERMLGPGPVPVSEKPVGVSLPVVSMRELQEWPV